MSHLQISRIALDSCPNLPRRFGAEPDHENDGYGRHECSCQHDSPGVVADSVEDQVRAETEKDPKSDPELERHDEGTSDDGRGATSQSPPLLMLTDHSRLRGVDWDCGNLIGSASPCKSQSRLKAPSFPCRDR